MMLEEAKNVVEKKYDKINEQNKILHTSRLEALHIKLAEKHRDYAGISSDRTAHALPDAGLQNVVNYLRGSKEIAETEIPLLKQEKLRMQSQLSEVKKPLYERDEVISQLEKDLAKSRKELSERDGKLNEIAQVVASLTSEIENQNKYIAKVKGIQKKFDVLVKEKEELQKQNEALSKQAEDWKQDTRTQDKNKLIDGLQKHKQARERLADEVERVKHAKGSLPEGTSEDLLDDLSAAYQLAVDNVERVAHSVCDELRVPSTVDISSVDASPSVVTPGQALTSQSPLVAASIITSSSPAKSVEEPGKKFVLLMTHVERRKMKRRLLRSCPKKRDGPHIDSEKPEAEQSNIDEKPFSSHNSETRDAPSQLTHTFDCKRLAPSTSSEPGGASSDVEAPAPKKTKGSDSPQETIMEGNETAISDNLETIPKENLMETEKDDGETGEQEEDQKLDTTNQPELQSNSILQEFEAIESESEREEGELLPAAGDIGDEMVEAQTEPAVPLVSSPLVDDDIEGPTETNASQALNDEADLTEANQDESADNSNDGNNYKKVETDAETLVVTTGEPKNERADLTEANEDESADNSTDGNNNKKIETDAKQ